MRDRELREEVAALRSLVEQLGAQQPSAAPVEAVTKNDLDDLVKSIKGVDQALAKMNGILNTKVENAEREAMTARDDVATLLGEVSELSGHYAQQEARLRAIAQALLP